MISIDGSEGGVLLHTCTDVYVSVCLFFGENCMRGQTQCISFFTYYIMSLNDFSKGNTVSLFLFFVYTVCVYGGEWRLRVGCGGELWACVHVPQREQGFVGYWMEGSGVGL